MYESSSILYRRYGEAEIKIGEIMLRQIQLFPIYESRKITKNYWLHRCNRCEYEWPSKREKPNTCADKKCRSPYWNSPELDEE